MKAESPNGKPKANPKAKSTSYKPGQTGNAGGRPKLPEDLKKVLKNTREIMIKDMCSVLSMSVDRVTILAMDEGPGSASTALMASVLKRAIKTGCHQRAQLFLNYIIGKPQEFNPDDLDQDDEEQLANTKKTIDAMPSSVLTEAMIKYQDEQKISVRS